ncbi:Bgt-50870 [Blumeria graminis f. sp. tritici]|uniref:Bgt-50870 n=1 Tax=Blumeria graminis f. sp. tritici TaxID=62690 RepID=A0A9X9LBH7_BLUGR|nr:Bgt-50870 [Blumeria graminis f. sp. tritici]
MNEQEQKPSTQNDNKKTWASKSGCRGLDRNKH